MRTQGDSPPRCTHIIRRVTSQSSQPPMPRPPYCTKRRVLSLAVSEPLNRTNTSSREGLGTSRCSPRSLRASVERVCVRRDVILCCPGVPEFTVELRAREAGRETVVAEAVRRARTRNVFVVHTTGFSPLCSPGGRHRETRGSGSGMPVHIAGPTLSPRAEDTKVDVQPPCRLLSRLPAGCGTPTVAVSTAGSEKKRKGGWVWASG